MNGEVKKPDAFDIGIKFGTPGIGKDDVRSAVVTLEHDSMDLTLDVIAFMRFGTRYTSVGDEDGSRDDSSKNVGIAIPDNSAPTAVDDTYTTEEDTTLIVAPPGVLGNDSDPDGDNPHRDAQHRALQRHSGAEPGRLFHLHTGPRLQRARQLHL